MTQSHRRTWRTVADADLEDTPSQTWQVGAEIDVETQNQHLTPDSDYTHSPMASEPLAVVCRTIPVWGIWGCPSSASRSRSSVVSLQKETWVQFFCCCATKENFKEKTFSPFYLPDKMNGIQWRTLSCLLSSQRLRFLQVRSRPSLRFDSHLCHTKYTTGLLA